MKSVFLLLIAGLVGVGCSKYDAPDSHDVALAQDTLNNTHFPILIDSGKRIVYQFSKMTPRGPRYFLDTMDVSEGLSIPSLSVNYLFPLAVSAEERSLSPGIIAISLPGYFEETVFGLINDKDQLRINYKGNELFLPSAGNIDFSADQFKSVFEDTRVKVQLDVALEDTRTGVHRAGKGKLKVFELGSLVQECDVFLVGN